MKRKENPDSERHQRLFEKRKWSWVEKRKAGYQGKTSGGNKKKVAWRRGLASRGRSSKGGGGGGDDNSVNIKPEKEGWGKTQRSQKKESAQSCDHGVQEEKSQSDNDVQWAKEKSGEKKR